MNFPVSVFGGFVQDHWSVSPHLTIDLGVRYDFELLPSDFNQDTDNVSPRVGVAWSPTSLWVFRAGYGVFFDRYILANLAQAVENDGVHAFGQVVDAAVAPAIFAANSGGSAPASLPGVAPSIFRADPRMPTPYSRQASAGVEYLLGANLTLSANYLFVRGLDLPRTVNVNLPPPVTLTPGNAASLGSLRSLLAAAWTPGLSAAAARPAVRRHLSTPGFRQLDLQRPFSHLRPQDERRPGILRQLHALENR